MGHRNLAKRAMQGVELREYSRLVDLYSRGCQWLARLLKIEGRGENGRLEQYLHAAIDQAMLEVRREWGLDDGRNKV